MNAILLLIIGIPAIEIYLMIKVGGFIGALNTIFLIFFTAITGVYFAKLAGLNTLKSGFTQIVKNEINIVGYTNIPSRLAGDASRLYARNIFAFLENIWNAEQSKINISLEDEIVKGTLLTKDGKLL